MTIGALPIAAAAVTSSEVVAWMVPFAISAITIVSVMVFTSNDVCLISEQACDFGSSSAAFV
jgi:hypothetical protein